MKNQFHLINLLLALTFIIAPGCALTGAGAPIVSTCIIPSDQSGSILGHWIVHPISLAFHAGDFNSTELAAMTAAVDTWNTFFNGSKSFPIYTYGSSSSPMLTTNANAASSGLCSTAATSNGQFTTPIGIYKLTSWPAYYSTSFIALTSSCSATGTTASSNGQTYNTFSNSVMEINYQNFFVSGTEQPDLQSVFLHELGHLAGLDHSCGSKPNMPSCTNTNLSSDYLAAVMYPVFNFDSSSFIGEQKRNLMPNDESRTNCLY